MIDKRSYILVITLLNIIGHIGIMTPLPAELRALAGVVIVFLAPGLMLFHVVTERAGLTTAWVEAALLGPAAGYALATWTLLLLAYMPGGLTGLTIMLAFDALFVVLAAMAWWGPWTKEKDLFPVTPGPRDPSRRILIALLSVLLVAAFFRLANLSYAEFQGDEAKVMVYGASVVQGYEDTLFIHRKGPTEILYAAGGLALLGQINEGAARLPFALGNIISVGLLFLLGYRLNGLRAAWIGGMFLALDGYYIGHTRMVQYQTVIFLAAAGTLYCLYWLYQLAQNENVGAIEKPKVRALLYASAIFFVTGLVTHYEGAIVGLPATFILYRLWRHPRVRLYLGAPLAGSAILVALLAAIFYAPFIRHPYFQSTLTRYATDVTGAGQRLYNNIPAFTERGQLYNFTWLFYVMMAALALHVVFMYWRRPSQVGRWGSVAFSLLFLAAIFSPGRSMVSGFDWTVIGVGVFLLAALAAPGATTAERLLWLWLGPGLYLSLFLVSDPSGHFYIFYAPLALLTGLVLAILWNWLVSHMGPLPGHVAAAATLGLLFTLGGIYQYAYYVYHGEEVVRNWNVQQTLPRWMTPASRESNPIFGIPHYSGWKAIGALFETGQLSGSYATNVRTWIGDWYTRSAEYCEEDPDMVFIEIVERPREKEKLLEKMGDRYRKDAVISVNGEPRIDIYRRAGEASESVTVYDARAFDAPFNQTLSNADLHITAPEIDLGLTPVSYRFGNDLELTGYQLYEDRAPAGGSLSLLLTWRALRPIDKEYIAFLQALGPEWRKVGQRDVAVGCNEGPTYDWDAGETVLAHYRIPLLPDETPGVYPLYVGLYDRAELDRAPITDAQGQPIGDMLKLADITLESRE